MLLGHHSQPSIDLVDKALRALHPASLQPSSSDIVKSFFLFLFLYAAIWPRIEPAGGVGHVGWRREVKRSRALKKAPSGAFFMIGTPYQNL
jgi:hypothetical protein